MIKFLFFIFIFVSSLYANPVKLIVIERLTHFIEWPYLTSEFKIGVYQNKVIAKEMENFYREKNIHKLPIRVINIESLEDIRNTYLDLIYFPNESNSNTQEVIDYIKLTPILSITETTNDVYNGMHIGLYYKNKKLKFLINKEAIDKAKLKASYKLLKLAKIVKRVEK